MASVSKEIGAAISLPNEILVRIFEKLDLKTLFNCKRVCRRFYQIACEVNTITFVAPSRRWKANNSEFCEHVRLLAGYNERKFSSGKFGWMFSRSVGGLINSMTKFTRLKSLYIELPLSSIKGSPHLKWKVFIDSNIIDSFALLVSTSIHDTKGSSYVDDHEEEGLPYNTTKKCMEIAFIRYLMLLAFARKCPFLEKITITDPRKSGRIGLSGAKLSEVRNSFTSIAPPDEVDKFISKVEQRMSSSWVRGCNIPLLYLRDSGFVMKGVKLTLYSFEEEAAIPDEEDNEEKDDFEDQEEEATYSDFQEQNDLPYEYEYGYEEEEAVYEQNDLQYEYEYGYEEKAAYKQSDLPYEYKYGYEEEEAAYEQNDLPYEYKYGYEEEKAAYEQNDLPYEYNGYEEEEAAYEQNDLPYEYKYGYEEEETAYEQNDLQYGYKYGYVEEEEEVAYSEEEDLRHGSYSDSDAEEDDFEDEEEEAAHSDFGEQNNLLYEYRYSYDGYINIDEEFEDKEEAAFSEALMEIFNKHSDSIRGPGFFW